MTFSEFLAFVDNLNIRLSLDSEQNVKVNAPKGVLTPAHRDLFKKFKSEIIAHLKSKDPQAKNSIAAYFSELNKNTSYRAPCSTMQKSMWLTAQMQSLQSTYNMSGAFEIAGDLSSTGLEFAFRKLIARHDILRTGFAEEDGEIWQVVSPNTNFVITTKSVNDATLNSHIAAEANHPFDLTKPGLIKVSLFRLSEYRHVLTVTLHHIIADGWSLQILVNQLNQYYSAFIAQSDTPKISKQLQYADYAKWQSEQLATGKLRKQLSYWQETLAEQQPLLEIPTDRPRPAQQNFRGHSIPFQIGAELKTKLEELSQGFGVTLNVLLLTGLNALLSKYCNLNDISVGIPTANRPNTSLQHVLGLFVNTVVIRTKIDSSRAFNELLSQVKDASIRAMSNSEVPFEHVVDCINPERSAAYHPLCQVFFSLQHQEETRIQLSDLDCLRIPHKSHVSRVDLSFLLNASEHSISGHIEYATALFDQATIENLANSYKALLEKIALNPTEVISGLSAISEDQHQQIEALQGSRTDYPERIESIVAEKALQNPDAIAITFEEQNLTYLELNQLATRVAKTLLSARIKEHTRVGVFLRPSRELPIVLLGILQAGCAYVPLDTRHPDARLNLMINDANLEVIIGETELKQRVEFNCRFYDIETVIERAAKFDSCEMTFPVPSKESELLCIKYTSGSTGTPKGVRVTHRNILRLAVNSEYVKLNSETVMLQYAALSFDAAALEIWGTLANGGHLVIADPAKVHPADLADFLRAQPINSAFFTTSLFNELITHHDEILASLKLMMVGGEAFNPKHAQKVVKLMPNVTAFNVYGPTENGVFSCVHRLNVEEDYSHSVPIGHCVNNSHAYVLDSNLQLVPLGGVGEIWVGGDGLSQGYHERDELTNERFVFHEVLGMRLYRTGDIGRIRADGQFTYLGRTDNQIKIRGYRIEIEEVEAQLLNLPGVSHVAVFCEGEGATKRLSAYIKTEYELSAEDIQFGLYQALPAYMVPSEINLLDVVPYTTTGKLDRRALRSNIIAQPTSLTTSANELENQLLDIWQSIIDSNRVTLDTNFFQSGGNSLTAIRLLTQVRKKFDIAIPAAEFLVQPTPAHLARLIEQYQNTRELSFITKRQAAAELKLSPNQQRMWLMQEYSQGEAIHNISAGVHLNGALNIAALKTSIASMVNEHRVFRTQIINQDGTPKLQYHSYEWLLQQHNEFNNSASDKTSLISDLVDKAAKTDFDLAEDWLFRAVLYTFSKNEFLLVLSIHHIISDGWSVGLMMEELGRRYQAYLDGQNESAVAVPELQYDDYAHWHNQLIGTDIYEEQIDYWKEKLNDIPPAADLPYLLEKNSPNSFLGRDCFAVINQSTVRRLRSYTQTIGVSEFSVLFSVFHGLLARLTNQKDLTIGIPSAGRNHPGMETILGYFVNTLAIRHQWNLAESFNKSVTQMATTIAEALSHQDAPYHKIVETVRPMHGRGESTLFNVFFNMLNLPESELMFDGLTHSIVQANDSAAKFDITLYLKETRKGLAIQARFNAEKYDYEHIEELLNQYLVVLDQALESPEKTINHWDLNTALGQSIIDQLDTTAPKSSDRGILGHIETQISETPNATAITSSRGNFSYQEIAHFADNLMGLLKDSGARQKQVIAIYSDRSPELIISILAVLKLNGVFVILDSNYPDNQLLDRIATAAPSCIITCTDGLPDLLCNYVQEHNIGIFSVDFSSGKGSFTPQPQFSIAANDTAYISFTSGTTGRAKAVLGSHRGLERAYLNWINEPNVLRRGTRFSMLSGLGHDPLHRDIFLALASGGNICIPNDNDIDPTKLGDWLQNNEIEVANLTPAMLSLLLTGQECHFSSLRSVFSVGEALPWNLVAKLKKVSAAKVFNLYGTTETQQCLSAYRVPNQNPNNDKGYVPIGASLAGTTIVPLNSDGCLAGIGEIGELVIKSDGLAKGYLRGDNRDFFDTSDQIRSYRTGDLGIRQLDGSIKILGRNDRQMIIRGFRVEPSEIEHQLMLIENVDTAYVCIKQNLQGQDLLLAYVVGGNKLSERTLLEELKTRVSSHMLPVSIILMDELPRSPNGKIDESALPLPIQRTALPPLATDTTTATVASVWADTLDIPLPTKDMDFFQVGGHSLLAARIIAQLREKLGTSLSLKEFFLAPQISQISRLIKARQTQSQQQSILPVARELTIPLSLQQKRLWVLQQLTEQKSLYNISGGFELKGSVNLNALQLAFNSIIKRHEILRTSITTKDGHPHQRIENLEAFSIRHEKLVNHQLEQQIQNEAKTPFDLEKAPLLRVTLLSGENDHHVLLVTFHHLVFDGWSWSVLFNELSQLYNSLLHDKVVALPQLGIQFADYAHYQAKQITPDRIEGQLQYWQNNLAGLPPLLTLPTTKTRPSKQSFEGDLVPISIGAKRLRRLRNFSQQHAVTLHMTLLSVFQIFLSKLSGQTDIAVGTPVANRNSVELENLIGFFVNTLVIRTEVDPANTFLNLLNQVKQTTLDAYSNQDVPFEQIVEAIQPERSASYSPLFQVLFTMQKSANLSSGLSGIEIQNLPYQSHSARYDLVLNLHQSDDCIKGYLEFDAALFDKKTIERWLNWFDNLLDTFLQQADREIRSISMLSSTEVTQLLDFGQGPTKQVETGLGIHGYIESHAVKTPDAIAMIQGQRSLTYGQLKTQSDSIAMWLQQRGLRVNDRVGLCLERSFEFFVVMLAILKAGGSYVPIDPSYPAKRRHLIVEDADLFLLVTNQPDEYPYVDNLHITELLKQVETANLCDRFKACEDYTDLAAYMIYTSGSTGKPKGVSVKHGGLCNMIIDQVDTFHIDATDRVLQFASLSFDVSVKEQFLALASGASLVLPEATSGVALLESLQSLLVNQRISVAILLPTVLPHLTPQALPALRLVYTGAESVSQPLASLWSEGRCFINAYGPTECTVMASSFHCSPSLLEAPPIGVPIANSQLLILSEYDEWCGVGVAGEICIIGPGVAEGYWRQEALSKTKFSEFSLAGRTHRMYRTGDIGCWLEDGNLKFIGRRDNQIKIRGYRVEIDEIVATIQQFAHVNEVAVTVVEIDGHHRLHAWFVGDASVSQIVEHARKALPAHMVPAAFMQLEVMPYTTNRKIDFTRLPAIEKVKPTDALSFDSKIERSLVDAWSQVLGREDLSVDDNFFEVGGDSILALQTVSRCREAGVVVTAQQIFEYQTIKDIAKVCSEQQDSPKYQPSTGIVKLSPIQQWFFASVKQHNSWFNQGVVLQLKQPLAKADLVQAFADLISHHEILRARYEFTEQGWQQHIAESGENDCLFIEKDLTAEYQVAGNSCFESFCAELQRQFDLLQGPLVSAALVHLTPNQSRLVIFAHHLVIDGVSWRILIEDLQLLCEGRTSLQRTHSYQAYTDQCHKITHNENWLAQRPYWQNQLSGYARIPVDKNGENTVASIRQLSFELSEQETTELLTFAAQAAEIDVSDVLMTAYLSALRQWLGQDSIAINIESHGRSAFKEQVNLTRTVGWCTSLYPLTFDMSAVAGDAQLLDCVRMVNNSVPNQGLGFGLLQYLHDSPIVNRQDAMPDTGFNYLGQFDSTFKNSLFAPATENTGNLSHEQQVRTQKLSVNALIKNNRLKVNWGYSDNLHFETTIQNLVSQFGSTLKNLINAKPSDVTTHDALDLSDADLTNEELDDLLNDLDF